MHDNDNTCSSSSSYSNSIQGKTTIHPHLILKMYNGGKAGLELSTLLFK